MILLKPGKGEAIRARRHPWIYSGAVERAEGEALSGALAPVADSSGRVLGWGFYSPSSLIAVRLASLGEEKPVAGWLEQRILRAHELRMSLSLASDAYRLVNAEGDFLPGLIVDVYHQTTVVRPLIRGLEAVMEELLGTLRRLYPDNSIFLKRDEKAARLERLSLATGYLHGSGEGRERIEEGGLAFLVDIQRGQKTGFYLDQRENRRLARLLAAKRRVLNLFAYTGSFSLQAAAGGAADVVSVESSSLAVEIARENVRLNPAVDPERLTWIEGDAFSYLEGCPSFDLIVADPPPFARRRSELDGALKGYGLLNRQALARTSPGGFLATFSCSSAVSAEMFAKVIREAARQAGREVQLLQGLHADRDHPVALRHPEGEYLKGWLLRVM